jgi:hypothetical protein
MIPPAREKPKLPAHAGKLAPMYFALGYFFILLQEIKNP